MTVGEHDLINRIVPAAALHRGTLRCEEPGVDLGFYVTRDASKAGGIKRWRILSAGLVFVGIGTRVLGAVPGQRWAFMCADGRLWRVTGSFNPAMPALGGACTADGYAEWADAVARRFLDAKVAPVESRVMGAANARYRAVVAAHVGARVLQAADLGYTVSAGDYARGVCATWTERDLLGPRYATMRHALLVSIVLSLDAHEAASLVELAALLELRSPFVSREAATAIVRETYSCMEHLCPSWSVSRYLLRWARHGTIDVILRAQFGRMMHGAATRDVPFDAVAGLDLDPLTAAGTEDESED